MNKTVDISLKMVRNTLLNKKTAIILVIVGVMLILFSNIIFPTKKESDKTVRLTAFDYDAYIKKIEEKIVKLVEGIEGAGECRVMITLENSGEKIYATEDKTNENAVNDKNGADSKEQRQTENETKITVISGNSEQEPVVIKEISPEIRGVAVICTGGDNAAVQSRITRTLSALLGISTNRISVTK